jgi:hypothetical protein
MADIVIQTYKQHPNWVTAGLVVAGITGGLLGISGISLIISSGVSMPGLNVIRDTLKPWGEGLAGGGALLTGGFILVGTVLTSIKIWRYKDVDSDALDSFVNGVDKHLGDLEIKYREWGEQINEPSAKADELTQAALDSLTSIILNSEDEKVIVKALGLLQDLQDGAYRKMAKAEDISTENVVTYTEVAKLLRVEKNTFYFDDDTRALLDVIDERQKEILKQIAYACAYGWAKLAAMTVKQKKFTQRAKAANRHLVWIATNFPSDSLIFTQKNRDRILGILEKREPMVRVKKLEPQGDGGLSSKGSED